MRLTDKINARFLQHDLEFYDLVGREVTFHELRRLAARVVKPWARVKLHSYAKAPRYELAFSGTYWCHTSKIDIILHHPEKTTTLQLRHVNRFRQRLNQFTQHELVHKDQHKKFGSVFTQDPVAPVKFNVARKLTENQEFNIKYLSDKIEIDAYGHDIAYEIQWLFPNKDPYTILNSISRYPYARSQYTYYQQAFKNIDWTPIRKHLLRRAWRWLPTVKALPNLIPQHMPL